jgi:metal-responsive CopG/Arc/MetJ family transcriptional regulator
MSRSSKSRVTISISRRILKFVDHIAGSRGTSRSDTVESLIRESQNRREEEHLAEAARAFFADPQRQDEAAEREDWLQAGLETWKRGR